PHRAGSDALLDSCLVPSLIVDPCERNGLLLLRRCDPQRAFPLLRHDVAVRTPLCIRMRQTQQEPMQQMHSHASLDVHAEISLNQKRSARFCSLNCMQRACCGVGWPYRHMAELMTQAASCTMSVWSASCGVMEIMLLIAIAI